MYDTVALVSPVCPPRTACQSSALKLMRPAVGEYERNNIGLLLSVKQALISK